MCLGIPGEVVDVHEQHGLRFARVRFGGIFRDVCVEYVPEAAPGDFVLVHVGFAISRIDAEQADRTFQLLEELGQIEEQTSARPEGERTQTEQTSARPEGERTQTEQTSARPEGERTQTQQTSGAGGSEP